MMGRLKFGIRIYLLSVLSNGGFVCAARDCIVGGSDAPVDSYQWFVKFNGCGGTLVSPEFVLTAGKVPLSFTH